MPYLAWYGQAGTPRLHAKGTWDAAKRQYVLTLRQHTPATPGQKDKQPLPIPVRMALFDRQGKTLPLRLDTDATPGENDRVLILDTVERSFIFEDLAEAPVASLLRGFSAPVQLDHDLPPSDLAILLRSDPSGYDRWAAGQQLAACAFDTAHSGVSDNPALDVWTEVLSDLFDDASMDPALLAELLNPAGEIELSERIEQVDPDTIHASRQHLLSALAGRIGAGRLLQRLDALQSVADDSLDALSQARRRLKRQVLELLTMVDSTRAMDRAQMLFRQAGNMTDRLNALRVLLGSDAGEAALASFRKRHQHLPLALDKWFAVQAEVPGGAALQRVRGLLQDPIFTLRNPNRVNALLGSYARMNPSGFHRTDGAGYLLLTEKLAQLDALNPQVAARLAGAFNGWQRLEPVRREAAHAALAALAASPELSVDLNDILHRALEG
jgi:aminopeptidase N